MTSEKRRKLEEKGWRVGSAQEFLGLSDPEVAILELRLRLADGLRAARAASGLTQNELARGLGSSQSRVAKMEAGDPSVSLDLLVRALLALGLSIQQLAAILDGGRTTRKPARKLS